MSLLRRNMSLLRSKRTLRASLIIMLLIWFKMAFLTRIESKNNILNQDAHLISKKNYNLNYHEKTTMTANKNHHKENRENIVLKGLRIPAAAEIVESFGELGKPVLLPRNLRDEVMNAVVQGWKKYGFNQYVSDLISVKRKLPDPRAKWCKDPGRFLKYLPQTSVIICFYNEAWSVLLRTVHSVLDNSPAHLIKEIILVDDFSDMSHLKQQLDDYMAKLPKVKIVRAQRREGLIRARLLGASYVTASVLTFLDSHCECAEGWLEPLLDRIARNKTTVVCPVIDVIDDNTFEYNYKTATAISVGGFDWNLQHSWHEIPAREKKRRKNAAESIRTPTIIGGLFSINKEFFEKLGTYDSDFDIWGGENLELSFKTWMCGGTLEIVPCSHVGHLFKHQAPNNIDVKNSTSNSLKKNLVRLAEVWMDDYAKYFYARIGYDKGDYGDISSRIILREKLKCKSFEWYLKNIYPELYIPGDAVASGQIRNLGFSKIRVCLDAHPREVKYVAAVGIYPCGHRGDNQYWLYSKNGEIRRDQNCLDYSGHKVVLLGCLGAKGNQLWLYNPKTQHIKHGSSDMCLSVSEETKDLDMEECGEDIKQQKWEMDNFNIDKLNLDQSSEE